MEIPIIVCANKITPPKQKRPSQLFEPLMEENSPSNRFSEVLSNLLKQIPKQATLTDLVIIRQTLEERLFFKDKPYHNLPYLVAGKNNLKHDINFYASTSGGNLPQLLINEFAEKISKKECKIVAILGGESLATVKILNDNKIPIRYGSQEEDPQTENKIPKPILLGEHKSYVSKVERNAKVTLPVNIYPLLEQSVKQRDAHITKQQIELNAEILSKKYNSIACNGENKEFSWFNKRRTKEDISTESVSNRWVSYPYTKYMNAVMDVDQWCGVLMMSESEAIRLKIPKENYMYLIGCGDAVEPSYYYSTRLHLNESFAMKNVFEYALKQAKIENLNSIDYFDLYSCFPIAVTMACKYLGINPLTDNRDITVTGGLPFFGGAGNSYTLFAICNLFEKLTKIKEKKFGLINANGLYLTKHSCGIYTNYLGKANDFQFQRIDPKLEQLELVKNSPPSINVCENPNGIGLIETYTVDFLRRKARLIILGKLLNGANANDRFLVVDEEHNSLINIAMNYNIVNEQILIQNSKIIKFMDDDYQKNFKPSGVIYPRPSSKL